MDTGISDVTNGIYNGADDMQNFLLHLDTLLESLHMRVRGTLQMRPCTNLHQQPPVSFKRTVDKATTQLVSVISGTTEHFVAYDYSHCTKLVEENLANQCIDQGVEEAKETNGTHFRVLPGLPKDAATGEPDVPISGVPELLSHKIETNGNVDEEKVRSLLQALSCHGVNLDTKTEPISHSSSASILETDETMSTPTFRQAEEEVEGRNSMKTQVNPGEDPVKRRAVVMEFGNMEDEDKKRMAEAKRREISHSNIMQATATLSFHDDRVWVRYLRTLVNSVEFEMFFVLVIVLNSIIVGVEVEYSLSNKQETHAIFYVLRFVFSAAFSMELTLRLLAHGCTKFLLSDQWAWNYLDVFIVGASLVENVLDIAALASNSDSFKSDMGAYSGMRLIRMVRITRIVRVVRITRVLRFVRALRTMLHSIYSTFKTLLWAMMLLIVLLYMIALLFTQAVAGYLYESQPGAAGTVKLRQYFGSIGQSMMTLFQVLTGGIDWAGVSDPLGNVDVAWQLLLTLWIAFGNFVFLNVMTGVFCQTAVDAAAHDQELVLQNQIANQNQYIRRIRQLFKKVDEDQSGDITISELQSGFENVQVRDYFKSLEIETEDAWTLFKLLDTAETNVIDLEEFIYGCLRLKGFAKSVDIAKMMYEQKWMMKRLADFTAAWEDTLEPQFQRKRS